MINFFIHRPIFAAVLAFLMVMAGAIGILVLPIAQYPVITPPEVQVSANYPGASSQVVADSVTTPLEEQINGVKGMIYMSSNSTNSGDSVITVTFDVGYDQDIGAVDVQNAAQIAEAQLPSEVTQAGVTVQKVSSDFVVAVNLISPNGTYDEVYLSNYADIHLVDVLARQDGVGQVTNFGDLKYAMRIWLDPDRMAAMGLTATDVMSAVQEQNTQVAAGAIGAPPVPSGQTFQYQLNTQGRLAQVAEFADIIVRTRPDGSVVRVKDIGRVELGAESYDSSTAFNGQPTATVGIFQLPDANAIDLVDAVHARMADLSRNFPDDLTYEIAYDTTVFVRQSIKEVVITLFEAIALVFLVTFVFLQSLRATIIPAIAIPVSLVGTFAVMMIMGFSINTLSLLGLVLAIGLVVDDAIVVVENVERQIENGLRAHEATRKAMAEVTGPIIATTAVLMAVFVPVAFIPGITGRLYNQFALTIAFSVGLSAINSLTLTPALCAIMLKPRTGRPNWFFRQFNRGFESAAEHYRRGVGGLARVWYLVVLGFVGLAALTVVLFDTIPTAFVPEEDQGYFLAAASLPAGASLERTEAVVDRMTAILQNTPGVADTITISGYNFLNGVAESNAAIAFVILEPWDVRDPKGQDVDALIGQVTPRFMEIQEAQVMAFNAPAIPGLGTTGGFKMEVQDLDAQGIPALTAAAGALIKAANQRPELAAVYTTFTADAPQYFVDIDRTKAKSLGLSLSDVFDSLEVFLGSVYVNNFNKFGRVYRVYIQAEPSARDRVEDLDRIYVRNEAGDMIPLSTLVTIQPRVGPANIMHYNLYTAIDVSGSAAPGHSSGEAIAVMDSIAQQVLPQGFTYQWTDEAYQEIKAGNVAPFIFALGLVMVFLFLAAQYESWVMPFMVLLAVPLALLGAVGFQLLRGLDLDVYAQIGLVMLIGLASKNAILIVEFARRRREEGAEILEAAMDAARTRLRPILMTAFAFILGVAPLAVATGAGAASRQSLGTVVIGGMLFSTLLSLVVVPVFYVVIERLRERRGTPKPEETSS